jgi:hypothetical protein
VPSSSQHQAPASPSQPSSTPIPSANPALPAHSSSPVVKPVRGNTTRSMSKPNTVDPRTHLLDETRQFIKVIASLHDDLEAQIIKCGEDAQSRWEFEKSHLPPEKLESTHAAISDESQMEQREIRRKFSERYLEMYQSKALDLRERLRLEVPGVAQDKVDMDYKFEYGGYPLPDHSGEGLQDYSGIVEDLTNLANALDAKIKQPQ